MQNVFQISPPSPLRALPGYNWTQSAHSSHSDPGAPPPRLLVLLCNPLYTQERANRVEQTDLDALCARRSLKTGLSADQRSLTALRSSESGRTQRGKSRSCCGAIAAPGRNLRRRVRRDTADGVVFGGSSHSSLKSYEGVSRSGEPGLERN